MSAWGDIWDEVRRLFRRRPDPPPPPPPVRPSVMADKLVALMNAERSKHGLASIVRHPALDKSAQGHCDKMVSSNVFSHQCPGEKSFDQRITAAGYSPWSYVSENLAAGQSTPEEVVADWMGETPPNDGHRRTVLGEAVHVGVGFSFAPSTQWKWYWTADFGRLR